MIIERKKFTTEHRIERDHPSYPGDKRRRWLDGRVNEDGTVCPSRARVGIDYVSSGFISQDNRIYTYVQKVNIYRVSGGLQLGDKEPTLIGRVDERTGTVYFGEIEVGTVKIEGTQGVIYSNCIKPNQKAHIEPFNVAAGAAALLLLYYSPDVEPERL